MSGHFLGLKYGEADAGRRDEPGESGIGVGAQ